MDEEARRNGEELLEVRLLEVPFVAFFDHSTHGLQRGGPDVVPVSVQAQIGLKLLEKLQQVVEVLGQLQIENL